MEESLSNLEQYNMISSRDGEKIELNSLGEATSKQLISPSTVARAYRYLENTTADEFDRLKLFIILAASPLLNKGRVYSWEEFDTDLIRDQLYIPSDIADEDLENAVATAYVIDSWIQNERLDEAFEEYDIADSRTSSDITDRAAPLLSRGIKVIKEVIEEADDELYSEYYSELDTLETRVRYGFTEEDVSFVSITTDRGLITNMRENIGIDHPEEIAEGELTTLFGNMGYNIASKLTRRAVNEYCGFPEREINHTLIDARDMQRGVDSLRKLLEASEEEFERRCEELLNSWEDCMYNSHDERGSGMVAEGSLAILNERGDGVYKTRSAPLEVAVECKSKQNLSEDRIGPDNATSVVRKSDNEGFLLTIGNPGFTEDAVDAAERQDVLLLPATAFATLMIYSMENNYSSDTYADIFTETGVLYRNDILRILDEGFNPA